MASILEDGKLAPLRFFYAHLHDAIRAELDSLAEAVLQLEGRTNDVSQIKDQLSHLQARYGFLEQVYKYHSNVEDEVVYPALDSKVKNVTRAYTVEHQDEEFLLDELSQLLAKALASSGDDPAGSSSSCGSTLRELARKVEEVHTTLRKHLAKEEHQLLPLLLQHFCFREQAELVAQFLCSIPLAAVHPVLHWIKRAVPLPEQASLQQQVQAAVPDPWLRQLMQSWLAPEAASSKDAVVPGTPEPSESLDFVCCGSCRPREDAADAAQQPAADTGAGSSIRAVPCPRDVEDAPMEGPVGSGKPPLREIMYFHQAIRSALASFAEEAKALHASEGGVAPAQLAALVERHRFIRAVCLFHSASEDEIVFPALRRVASSGLHPTISCHHWPADASAAEAAGGGARGGSGGGDSPSAGARHRCEDEHITESSQFEELGRLLGDVKAGVRRGSKGVGALTEDLSQVADRLARAMSRHMAREESEVLPPLMRSLCAAEQRHMVWRLVRAMPLRLLERVMPWVAGKLREDDLHEWLGNIRRAAPASEAPLVELLVQWARRGEGVGRTATEKRQGRREADDPAAYSIETCTPATAQWVQQTQQADQQHQQHQQQQQQSALSPRQEGMGGGGGGAEGGPALKRIRTNPAQPSGEQVHQCHHHHHHHDHHELSAAAAAAAEDTSMLAGYASEELRNPIDHIFQFHKALRRELKELENAAIELQAEADASTAWAPGDALSASIQALQARFQFLRGIYRAHSSAEDEIVFPALEAKETLHNVSHAYTLDHKQEESLFEEVSEVIAGIGSCSPPDDLPRLRSLVSKLARQCAAVRAALETHVRAEETELWPLFAENFSIEEQQHLVGMIIGRTGAEVLHAMLSWVKGSLDPEEHTAMMLSLKSASKATAFEQWLGAAMEEGGSVNAGSGKNGGGGGGAGTSSSPAKAWEEEQQEEVLAEVARYLAKHGITAGGGGGGPAAAAADPTSVAADAAHFRPGWEDIFRMNQKQLEAAVRRVSADASLEPQRKAYLIQHLMASRYIVAQQQRRVSASVGGSAGATPLASMAVPLPQQQQQQQGAASSLLAAAENFASSASAAAAAAAAVNVPSHRRFHDPAANVLGCKHYRRRAMLVAPCCGGEFVCRLCHDEAEPTHQLDRYAVNEMRCMECGTRQAVGAACIACGASMARYYCSICHLFDDDPHRDIYHCQFCNFCRRGKGLGVDSFHCMSCNACMSLELFNKHRCTERALAGTCPVCSDPLFDSSAPIKELPCGHFMHSLCFAAYTRYSYTCPVCTKSLGDMAVYWKMIDSLLAGEALPPEYAARKQVVRCNDCAVETQAPFHFVYHKCGGCGGYNTRVQK